MSTAVITTAGQQSYATILATQTHMAFGTGVVNPATATALTNEVQRVAVANLVNSTTDAGVVLASATLNAGSAATLTEVALYDDANVCIAIASISPAVIAVGDSLTVTMYLSFSGASVTVNPAVNTGNAVANKWHNWDMSIVGPAASITLTPLSTPPSTATTNGGVISGTANQAGGYQLCTLTATDKLYVVVQASAADASILDALYIMRNGNLVAYVSAGDVNFIATGSAVAIPRAGALNRYAVTIDAAAGTLQVIDGSNVTTNAVALQAGDQLVFAVQFIAEGTVTLSTDPTGLAIANTYSAFNRTALLPANSQPCDHLLVTTAGTHNGVAGQLGDVAVVVDPAANTVQWLAAKDAVAAVATVATQLNTVTAQLAAVNTVNASQQTAITNLANDVTAISTQQTAFGNQLNIFNTSINDVNNELTAVNTANTAQQTAITQMLTTNTEQQTAITQSTANIIELTKNQSWLAVLQSAKANTGLPYRLGWIKYTYGDYDVVKTSPVQLGGLFKEANGWYTLVNANGGIDEMPIYPDYPVRMPMETFLGGYAQDAYYWRAANIDDPAYSGDQLSLWATQNPIVQAEFSNLPNISLKIQDIADYTLQKMRSAGTNNLMFELSSGYWYDTSNKPTPLVYHTTHNGKLCLKWGYDIVVGASPGLVNLYGDVYLPVNGLAAANLYKFVGVQDGVNIFIPPTYLGGTNYSGWDGDLSWN